jgi:poly(hydroxyalkanoate) depolymerase family esterase
MKHSDKLSLRNAAAGQSARTAAPKPAKAKPRSALPTPQPGRLVELNGFGDDPGKLRMLAHLPQAAAGRPLVILLHGCAQDAAVFAGDTGWTDLADRLGFPLILPDQPKMSMSGRCFDWYRESDTARDAGEAGSIASMTRAAVSHFKSDPGRVFILGLSAGGAMTAALLAAYPDLFAAGASVAGVPVGAARSGMQAIMQMRTGGREQSPEEWAARVRAAAPEGFAGPWPRLSVWQGQADTTVAPGNGDLLATQWCALHGLDGPGAVEQAGNGIEHRTWPDRRQPLVEYWSLPDLPHAYPAGEHTVVRGRFVQQAPIDATANIARFFELD